MQAVLEKTYRLSRSRGRRCGQENRPARERSKTRTRLKRGRKLPCDLKAV
jgi:hypothetical protein